VSITAIILTFNEEIHIERCINSIKDIVDEIVIVDSYSSDKTIEIATSLGAKVYQNTWVNYASQFNFAIDSCNITSDWLIRLDADEVFTPELCISLPKTLDSVDADVTGIYIKRKIVFLEKWMAHGGIYPAWMLRIFRNGAGRCELRWMDEHIKLDYGSSIRLEHDIIDDNLNNLCWWSEKHVGYAKREMVDLLNNRFQFFDLNEVEAKLTGTQEQRKRWLKNRYSAFPLFVRPFIYFIYRYLIKGGFLDGKAGFVWCFLQGFWYRLLVDAIILDVQLNSKNDKQKAMLYIKEKYKIDLF